MRFSNRNKVEDSQARRLGEYGYHFSSASTAESTRNGVGQFMSAWFWPPLTLAKDPSSSIPYCFFARRRFRLVMPGVFVLPFSFFPAVFLILSHSVPCFLTVSYIKLPPCMPPFRANSKGIRMAIDTTYMKTKNFFVARTGTPVHFSVRAFIDRASLCVDALSRTVLWLPSSFCILYTPCSSIVCSRVVIYADVVMYTYHDYVKRILKAKKNVT